MTTTLPPYQLGNGGYQLTPDQAQELQSLVNQVRSQDLTQPGVGGNLHPTNNSPTNLSTK
jgi:hypothetical protein